MFFISFCLLGFLLFLTLHLQVQKLGNFITVLFVLFNKGSSRWK
tara:strand:- start:3969 stop:4100 length:132 start_codon:yes stop_codon:yes gene_type:complete